MARITSRRRKADDDDGEASFEITLVLTRDEIEALAEELDGIRDNSDPGTMLFEALITAVQGIEWEDDSEAFQRRRARDGVT